MSIEALLTKANQHHLLKHLDTIGPGAKNRLIHQLESLDWNQITSLIANHLLSNQQPPPLYDLEPAPYFPLTPATDAERDYYRRARAKGEELIAAGAVAAFTVAGGQGSRLGFAGPKGQLPVSPIKNKSLFQIFSEKIQYHTKRHDIPIPWYVMTSTGNHDDTCTFFDEQNYFGMNPADVRFFQQGELPAFTPDGKLILAAEDRLFMSPDGHGGSLKALRRSGALDDMKKRGCRYVSYFQVDNPLVSVFDPLFIGLHHLEMAQVSSRMLPKAHSREKIGVFCTREGRLEIIEYSDLPADLAEARTERGTLKFIAGSPAIHIFSVDFVEELNNGDFSLPFHQARKTIPYYTTETGLVEPSEPNGIKLETFVFDSLKFTDRTVVLEADRSGEFAPVKNAEGADSPDTCRHLMMAMFARWLKKNGVNVPETAEGELLCKLEISPLAAVSEDDLAGLNLPDCITPNQEVYINELSCRPIPSG